MLMSTGEDMIAPAALDGLKRPMRRIPHGVSGEIMARIDTDTFSIGEFQVEPDTGIVEGRSRLGHDPFQRIAGPRPCIVVSPDHVQPFDIFAHPLDKLPRLLG